MVAKLMPSLKEFSAVRTSDCIGDLFERLEPIGFNAGDTNLYRYVGNGPTNATDPLGLAEIKYLYVIEMVDKPSPKLPPNVPARTLPGIGKTDLNVECYPDGTWHLVPDSVSVRIEFKTYYDRKLTGDLKNFAEWGEGDHYDDIINWGNTDGTQRLREGEQVAVPVGYPTAASARAYLTNYFRIQILQPSFTNAVLGSKLYWDDSGRHQYDGANRRPWPSQGHGRPAH